MHFRLLFLFIALYFSTATWLPSLRYCFELSARPTLAAQNLPEGFYDSPVATGLDYPLGVTFDALGRMYVWEKAGRVWAYDSLGNRYPEPFLDIREQVAHYAEHGLNYLLLDKDFLETGYVYTYYVVDMHHYLYFGTPDYDPNVSFTTTASIGRVSRFSVNEPQSSAPPKVDPASEHILLGEDVSDGIPILMTSHGIGSIQQSEDGTLLLSNGDGASFLGTDIGSDSLESRISSALELGIIQPHQNIGSYKSQYRNVLNGKILRIDPETGDGLPSNPFYVEGQARHPSSRIWAMGFRNPYRMVLKPLSGSHDPAEGNPGFIITGDVGGAAWEEINTVPVGGLNFGWPVYEGNRNNWGFNNAPDLPNRFAPNPLYAAGVCNQEYFGFKELVRNKDPETDNWYYNDCDENRPITEDDGFLFATTPTIFWNNRNFNPGDKAALPIWNENNGYGYMDRISITDSRSWVEGHNFTGEASLGGVFYTASSYPEAYQNSYFHLDYSGWIRIFDFDQRNQLYQVRDFASDLNKPVHLALNPLNGDLYYISLQEDAVRRIGFGGNPPPVALVVTDQFYGGSSLDVAFDASPSYDPNDTPLTFSWDFGDNSQGSGPTPNHRYQTTVNAPINFTATLTVTDAEGASSEATVLISLNNSPPAAEITSFLDGDRYQTDQTSLLNLAADINDAESEKEALSVRWQAFLHHNTHEHPETPSFTFASHTFITPAGCSGDGGDYWYSIRLTVTDPQGLSTTRESSIYPNCSAVPANWINLSGSSEEQQVKLEFTTQLPGEVDYLEVQRSPDYYAFVGLARLNPDVEQSYGFVDLSPLVGSSYYRIKARMENGNTFFSNPEVFAFNSTDGFVLSPNPAADIVKINIFAATDYFVDVELFALNGQQLFTTRIPSVPGQQWQQELSLDGLETGMYLYRIKDGDKVYRGKLMVQD